MKRRNFLKWLMAIPAAFVASRLPIKDTPRIVINKTTALGLTSAIIPSGNMTPLNYTIPPGVKVKIYTNGSGNIEEWLKS